MQQKNSEQVKVKKTMNINYVKMFLLKVLPNMKDCEQGIVIIRSIDRTFINARREFIIKQISVIRFFECTNRNRFCFG